MYEHIIYMCKYSNIKYINKHLGIFFLFTIFAEKNSMNFNIDHKSTVPLHIQAEELLRTLINKEEYKNGKLLPNEVELSKQLNISRNTLRQAINKLVFEGLLIRKKGFGTKVASRSVLSGAKNWMSFSQEMKMMGIEVHNFELHVSWKRANEETSNFFGVESNTRLLYMERLRGKKELPFVYFISAFSPKIGLTGNEDFSQPLYDIIEKEKGVTLKISKEQIYAKPADAFLAEKLEIKIGDPILVRKRFVYDINSEPIEFNIGYYRADCFTYTIECERE